jgi:hypothetical protein
LTDADLLDLTETAELRASFAHHLMNLPPHLREDWAICEGDALFVTLRDYAPRLRDLFAVLFGSFDEYVGAIRVPASSVLANARDVWQATEQDLALTTLNLDSGICLERNFYDTHGSYRASGVFTLAAWGRFHELLTFSSHQ